jgi:hypothetical protein
MMGTIYRNAERTLVWLGETKDYSDDAMDAIASGSKGWIKIESQVIVALADRQYFSRIWIVRELFMSRRSDILIYCGRKVVRWDDFEAAVLRAMVHYTFYCSSIEGGEARRFRVQNSAIQIMKILDSGAQPLRILVELRWSFRSTDPRDRLFALLGMVINSPEVQTETFVTVDYSKPTVDIYVDIVDYILDHILDFEREDSLWNPGNADGAPNLVKFSQRLQEHPLWDDFVKNYRPLESLKALKSWPIKLYVHDSISWVSQTITRQAFAKDDPPGMEDFLGELLPRVRCNPDEDPWTIVQQIHLDRQNFLRVADLTKSLPNSSALSMIDMTIGESPFSTQAQVKPEVVIFVTENGIFGLAQANSQPGDLLCVDSTWSDLSAIAVIRPVLGSSAEATLIGRVFIPRRREERYNYGEFQKFEK